ncbi:hypothetical protein PR048_004053, partial [Dryococelus australis]
MLLSRWRLESIVKPPISRGFTYVTTCQLLYTPNSMIETIFTPYVIVKMAARVHSKTNYLQRLHLRHNMPAPNSPATPNCRTSVLALRLAYLKVGSRESELSNCPRVLTLRLAYLKVGSRESELSNCPRVLTLRLAYLKFCNGVARWWITLTNTAIFIMARRNLTPEQALQYCQEHSEIESEGSELMDSDHDYVPQNSDSTGSEDIDEPEDIIMRKLQWRCTWRCSWQASWWLSSLLKTSDGITELPAPVSLSKYVTRHTVRRGSGQGRGRGVECKLPGHTSNEVHAPSGHISANTESDIQHPVPVVVATLCSPNGTQWTVASAGGRAVGRMGLHNALRESSGPSPNAKPNIDVENVASAFQLIIDGHIVEELEAFIGQLSLRGVCGAKGLSIASLWSAKWSIRFYGETMFIRFDIKSPRPEHLEQDKCALVSVIWNRSISKSISSYKPGADITVGEQYFPTKAKCRFTQYVSSKPDKFGIKFWLAVDVDSKYILNGFPYLGKDEKLPSDQTLSENIVILLVDPYLDNGRNITMDNFFTSGHKCCGLGAVSTVNRSRRDIPAGVKNHNGRSLTIYQGKVNKNLLVITMHPSVSIGGYKELLPETISYYNSTKFGVDIADQMARRYSTKATSRRRPLH